jgi:hypothetical protein
VREGDDAGAVSNRLRRQGFDYATDHLDRVPVVVAARVARVWSLYAPGYMADYNAGEGRERWASWLGFVSFWLFVPVAVVGGVALRRRGVPLTPLVAQFVMVTITAVAIYGLVRFRVPAEVALVALAAVGADRLSGRRTPGSRSDAGGDAREAPGSGAGAVQSPDAAAGSPRERSGTGAGAPESPSRTGATSS